MTISIQNVNVQRTGNTTVTVTGPAELRNNGEALAWLPMSDKRLLIVRMRFFQPDSDDFVCGVLMRRIIVKLPASQQAGVSPDHPVTVAVIRESETGGRALVLTNEQHAGYRSFRKTLRKEGLITDEDSLVISVPLNRPARAVRQGGNSAEQAKREPRQEARKEPTVQPQAAADASGPIDQTVTPIDDFYDDGTAQTEEAQEVRRQKAKRRPRVRNANKAGMKAPCDEASGEGVADDGGNSQFIVRDAVAKLSMTRSPFAALGGSTASNEKPASGKAKPAVPAKGPGNEEERYHEEHLQMARALSGCETTDEFLSLPSKQRNEFKRRATAALRESEVKNAGQ